MSNLGGVYDSSSNANTHDDLFDVESTAKGRFNASSNYFHVYNADINFDYSYDEMEMVANCVCDLEFPLFVDEFEIFKVHSKDFLERDNDINQQVVCEYFNENFHILVTNLLFEECE